MGSNQNRRVSVRPSLIRYLALGALIASGLTFGVASIAGAATVPTNVVTNSTGTVLGGSITFTATVTGQTTIPGSTVTFSVSGSSNAVGCTSPVTLTPTTGDSATATCTLTAATAGTYIVSDIYNGDTNNTTVGSNTDTVTIAKVTPTNVVTNSTGTVLGGTVVFTATVTGPTNGATPSGTVMFTTTGSANVTGCSAAVTVTGSANAATATCTLTASAAGTYIVGDVYSGDGNYLTATSVTDTVTVAKVTPTNVVTDNGVTTVGGSIIYTATVTGSGGVTPTGTVMFTTTGSANVTGCSAAVTVTGSANAATATCTLTASAAGTYIVGDVYSGDGNYLTATSVTDTVTVAKVTPTNVVTDNGVTTVGGSIIYTATVTGSGGVTPTGTVAFTVGGSAGVSACTSSSATLAGSGSTATATCTITASAAGSYAVSDVFSSTGNYNAETSATDTVTASVASGGGGTTPPATNAPPPSGLASTSYGTPVTGSVTSGTPLTVTASSGTSSDAVSVPSGALPTGTVVSVYPITTTTALLAVIPSGQNYVTSIAVTWESGTTSPTATAPVTLTFTDASIAVGDTVYQLSSAGTLTSVGTATAAGSVTVTFTNDPVFVVTSATPLITPPPVVVAHATKVVGLAVGGRTVTVTILGAGFYGQPKIISSTGSATIAQVSHDSGTQLSVKVTVRRGTAKGVHTFKITLANGKSFDVHYSQR